ncbi:MAG TPA: molybdenum cofactor guanylyltransferase [bacterium]|nr:molybdenum cofactor guanylyltransferase [bacterium]
MHKDITGIVLAGGNSSRFGQDKALARIGGTTAIEIAVSLMHALFPRVMISARVATDYDFLNLPVIPDIHPKAGPLAGLYASLSQSMSEQNCVISCDLPLMSQEMISCLVTSHPGRQMVLAHAAGCLQFFPGLYNRSLLPLIESMFDDQPELFTRNRSLSLYSLMCKADAAVLDAAQLAFYREELYLNMNTPQDYEQIRCIVAAHSR